MATAYAAQPTTFEHQAMLAADPDYLERYLADKLSEIAQRLQRVADEAVQKRTPTEDRWQEDLRAFHGRYDVVTEQSLVDAEKSRAYVKITRKKTNSWEARLSGLLFPTDEENWEINSTPLPSLAESAKGAIQQAQAQLQQANAQMEGGDPASAESVAGQAQEMFAVAADIQSEIAEAKKRSELMMKEMKDQLIECDYPAECRLVIRDACRVGSGVLKGPLGGDRQRGHWVSIEGQHVYERATDPAPIFKWVNHWNYFPDPSAIRPEDREYEFERHLWSAKDMRRMVREAGFNQRAVRELLTEDRRARPVTDVGMSYLANLRSLHGTNEAITGRFVGWEYHGPLETEEVACILRGLGRDDEATQYEMDNDPLREVRVIVFFCEGKILKISPSYPLDSQESLYSIFTFEPSEASIFGYGIPHIMADSQKALNGAWRMALDNAGLSVGPQIFVDRDAIEPANGRWKLEPRKLWYVKKSGVAVGEVFGTKNVDNNVEEIMNIVETARRFIDDETALPVQAEGELTDTPNITATATNFMSMASNITFRRVVKSFDDGLTVPSIRRLYDWNMQHNANEDIKGDMKVDARGSSVLLLRELQSAMLFAVAQNWGAMPHMAALIKPYETAAAALRSAMIQPEQIMPTKEEYEQTVQQQAQAAQESQPPDPAVVAAESRLKATEIDAKSRIEVAEIQRDTALMQLAEQFNMKLEELATKLGIEREKIGSKERIFAGEAAMEDRLADKAAKAGTERQGSGGSL